MIPRSKSVIVGNIKREDAIRERLNMVLYGVKIHPNEGEDREETQGPEHFTRALLMIHELGESI